MKEGLPVFVGLSIGLGILAVVFAAQNAGPVQVCFLQWRFEGSLALAIVAAAAAGYAAGLAAMWPAILRHRRALAEKTAANEHLTEALARREKLVGGDGGK